jgi:hypothetical protein
MVSTDKDYGGNREQEDEKREQGTGNGEQENGKG